jgi:iron(III) transport system substrate-binding protein
MATQKILKELKLDGSILKGLDKELAVPKAWIDAAKKEGQVRLSSTFSYQRFPRVIAAFNERYPFIKVNYARGSFQQRVTSLIIAYKQKHIPTDVVTSFGGAYRLFKQADALANVRDLPGFNNLDSLSQSKEGDWVAFRRQYYCTAYNTNLVKAADLPKKWTDLLDNKRWHLNKIAIANRPQLWLIMLWGSEGPDYVKSYIPRLFGEVKPQLRKEGINAMISLAVAGEFHMAVPASMFRTSQMAQKKAPISFHCPEPVPTFVARMAVIKNNPHPFASKILVNWFISKEGQVAQFAVSNAPPAHKELQRREFLHFPDQVLGKKMAPRTISLLNTEHPKLLAIWNKRWSKGAGEVEEHTVTVKINATKRGGRILVFNLKGKEAKARISGRRTKILLGNKPGKRTAIKRGMSCAVTYKGDGSEAKLVSCK